MNIGPAIRKVKYISEAIAICLYFAIAISAQTQDEPLSSFKVGDFIYWGYMNSWGKGTIEEFGKTNGMIKVRYGQGRYDTTWITPGKSVILQTEKVHLDMMESQKMGQIFKEEARKYLSSVVKLMWAYDPELYFSDSMTNESFLPTPDNSADIAIVRRELAELDQLCKAKYPNLKNPPSSSKKRIVERYADQCAIAANRAELEKKTYQLNAERKRSNLFSDYQSRARNEMGLGQLTTTLQLMALDFDSWKADQEVKLRPDFLKEGAVVPPNFFDKLRPLSVELKAFIDNQAKTNQWAAPKFQDPSAQAAAKRGLATDDLLKKATVLSIGMDDASWAAGNSRQTEVGRDSKYVYFKTEKSKSRFKMGRMLVKGPIAGYCQERQFQVRQSIGGGATALEILDGMGKFVACP